METGKIIGLAGAVITAATCALAEPKVVTDIAPVHSIVARVMQGAGEPTLLIEPAASPHEQHMTPSAARALASADLVVWVGPELAPWIGERIDALAGDAASMALLKVPGVTLHDIREDARFEAHDHGDHAHDEHAHDEHGHDDHGHDDHAHDDHAHDDHGHDDHGHDHGHGADPHAWLDPVNAKLWTRAIADALAEADPANAALYDENAAAAEVELDALIAETEARLAPLRDRPFVVFHDAYQYFEVRFAIPAAGAISVSDARAPSAGRMAEIREVVADRGVVCLFAEPQFDPRILDAVGEGSAARTGVLDPLGADHAPGPGQYSATIRGLAESLEECLGAAG